MRKLHCGLLLVLSLLALLVPVHALAPESVELSFMPATRTVTLLNEGGKWI